MIFDDKRIKVVLFSGGRGCISISKVLNGHPQVKLTVLVNAYDDGLSTGRLRRYLPGMLGPSDIRKNICTLMPNNDRSQRAFANLLELRLPLGTSNKVGRECLLLLCGEDAPLAIESVRADYVELTVNQVFTITQWAKSFLAYEDSSILEFDYGDTSVGNLLFTGCYLLEACDFNKAIHNFSDFCELSSKVLNVTDGSNRVLTAIKIDGSFLENEAAIVSPQNNTPLKEIFLLEEYLNPLDVLALHNLSNEEKCTFLRNLEKLPEPNPEAIEALREADLIIFGPGTQHSSLLPSYMTLGLAEAILNNAKSEKVFVANICYDHDIQSLSAHDLLQSLCFYMSRKTEVDLELSGVVSRLFVQAHDATRLNSKKDLNYLAFNYKKIPLPLSAITAINWEEDDGRHSGGRIVDELLHVTQRLVDVHIKPYRHMISIIVPVLNEVNTLDRVLKDLQSLNFGQLEVSKEILVVDGGSVDGSLERLRLEPLIHLHQLADGQWGRGAAIRLGMQKAHGNVIVIFPADHEYDSNDIIKVAAPIMTNNFQLVLGSRIIRCDDINETLRLIYGKNIIKRIVSKYGGLLTSLTCLFLYKRYIGDPFTILKAIDANLLRQINLTSDGLDLETEIIAKARLSGQYILEVPVFYRPRIYSAGKKVTTSSGILALYRLIKCYFWRY